MTHLSATFIKDYIVCPQRAKYRLDKVTQKPSCYMIRGTAIHETLDNKDIITAEDAKLFCFVKFSELVNEQEVEFPYRVTFANMAKQNNTMLDYYYNCVNKEEPPVKESEVFFRVDINGTEVVGKMDQIRGKNIYDWKTRTKPVDYKMLAADYQFTLYGMAYKELYGEYPENIYYGALWEGKLYKMERTRKDYKYLEDVASKIVFGLENEIFPRNYGEENCKWCAYKHKCFNDKNEVIY